MNKPEFSVEDLREWQKDARGRVYWDEMLRLINLRFAQMRSEIRDDLWNKAAISEGFCEAMEEARQLPDLIIQEYAEEKKEKEK